MEHKYSWAQNTGDIPTEDAKFLENMTRVIFQAGLSWKMIGNKWPSFQEAFADFNVDEVAKFTEDEVEQLMVNKAIIRNEQKIRATIFNAQAFQEIAAEAGSFRKFLDQHLEKMGPDKTAKELQKRFHRVGKMSSYIFLWSVGVDMPHRQEHKKSESH